MEKENQLKNQLLFKTKGHFNTYKHAEKNELKIVRSKRREGTEIMKNKKGYNKAINLTKTFLGRILKMKKEIKKNEFFTKKDITNEIKSKKENRFLQTVSTNLKNSIIDKMKSKNEFNFIKQKFANNNIKPNLKNSNIPKKIKRSLIEKDINMININKSLDDISSSKLLNENKNTLEILNESVNKEEEKDKKENNRNVKFRKLLKKGLVYDSYDDEEEVEDQVEKDLFYINPNSIFIIFLDSIVFLITFYYLVYNPYYISSYSKFKQPDEYTFSDILNIIMECVFILDFILQFVRAYYDFDENLIKNSKKIVINYLNSWFFVDLICIFPIFTIFKLYYKEIFNFEFKATCRYFCQMDNLLYILTFLKMFKLTKLLSRNQNKFLSLLERFLSNFKFFNDWSNLIFQVILALIFLHVTVCIHIIIGRNSYPNWIIENNISEDSYGKIYISSFYFIIATITSVGYGDITGYSKNERIFQIFLLIIGIIAYSWMVSSISNYVRENNKDMTYFLSKVKILEDIRLSHPEMGDELYHKIYLYLKTLQLIHKDKDKDVLFESLPYNLKYSILYEINKPLIEGLNFFKNFRNSSFILNAVTKLIPIFAYQGDIIIEKNEIINSMIFVKQGRLSVDLPIDMNEIQNKINDYISGDFILKSEDENSDNNDEENKVKKDKNIKNLEFKRNNTISLMTTFNYSTGSLDNVNKKPVSFKKRMQQFLKNNKIGKEIVPFTAFKEKNIKYIKLYYIRKGEQYGEIQMFLNKPSTFTLRVRSPKAELLFLKKIDAIEISSNYPNIWKRANKKSFKNFVHLKQLVSKELVKFCDKNGIKYNKNFKKSMKHLNSNPMKIKENDDKKDNKKINIFKNFLFKNINNKEKKETKQMLENKENKIKSEKILNNKIVKFLEKNNEKKEEIKKLTPFNEFEINDEIYDGEMFLDKNNNINNTYNYSTIANTHSNQSKEIKIKDYSTFNSIKLDEEDNIYNNKKSKAKKDLIKLIDSSRTKSSTKLHYHKNKKPLFKNNNYNVQYNINNSFNIQNVQSNNFNQNNLIIIQSASFNIKNIYDNLNQMSKGKYTKDIELQNKIKKIFEKKYDKLKKVKLNITVDNNFNKQRINKHKSFFQRYSSQFTIKDLEKLNEKMVKRKHSFDKMKEEDKLKNGQNDKSDIMLNQITQNIIAGDQNLNNPETFYNEMFKNIMVSSSQPGSPKFKNKSKSTKKRVNKNFSSMRKSLLTNEENLNT